MDAIYDILGNLAIAILGVLYAIGVPFEVCTGLSFVMVPMVGFLVIAGIVVTIGGGVVAVANRWRRGN